MPEGDEKRTSMRRGDDVGTEDTERLLATAESTYVATLELPKATGGWKHVKPPNHETAPHTSGGSGIKTKVGRHDLVTTS